MFIIEDEAHAEPQDGEFETRQDAMTELMRRARIRWDKKPNLAPCTSWRTCGRRYELVEYDKSATPWKVLSRRLILEISAEGVHWHSATNED
jgi:hypothetical protein